MITASRARAIVGALVKLRGMATDEQACEVPVLYPEWKDGIAYESGERILYNGILYKVLTAHTSQAIWTPDAAASLFAKVLIPDENVIPEWEQPDSTNTYMTGDKVSHKDKVWISIVDNNSWEPGEYGWEEYINEEVKEDEKKEELPEETPEELPKEPSEELPENEQPSDSEEELLYYWQQPDSTNPYMIGDKVFHNDAVWVCVIDNNVWEPGVYGWEIVE